VGLSDGEGWGEGGVEGGGLRVAECVAVVGAWAGVGGVGAVAGGCAGSGRGGGVEGAEEEDGGFGGGEEGDGEGGLGMIQGENLRLLQCWEMGSKSDLLPRLWTREPDEKKRRCLLNRTSEWVR
jgi:hypothetical protein